MSENEGPADPTNTPLRPCNESLSAVFARLHANAGSQGDLVRVAEELKKEQDAAQGSATVAMIGWLLAAVFFALWYTAV